MTPLETISGSRERRRTFDWRDGVRAVVGAVDEFAAMVEKHPQPVMFALLLLYAAVAASNNQRPLWYDELTTNLAARLRPPFSQLQWDVRAGLQHGMLSWFLIYLSTCTFGLSAWAFRLPATLGYLAASGCLFVFVRRARAGNLFALLAVLLLWSTPSFYYATEARPYGLILGLGGVLLISWQHAVRHERRTASLAAIAVAELCLVFLHPLAILAAMPLLFGELVRLGRRRRADWPLWMCAGWPALGVIPLLMVHPTHPTFTSALSGRLIFGVFFYTDLVQALALPLLAGAFGALVVRRQDTGEVAADYALLFGGLVIPFAVNGILGATGAYPYFPRYAISGTLPVPVLAAVFLAQKSNRNQRVGLLALGAAGVCFLIGQIRLQQPETWSAPPVAAAPQVAGRPDLPLVAASGLTFMEMGYREPAPFVHRLYYLQDPAGARKYASSELYEAKQFSEYRNYFPQQTGNIAPYAEFLRTHRKFLVYGTVNYWEDWLLRRLMEEGAQLVWLGSVRGSYKDTDLYEVTVAGGEK